MQIVNPPYLLDFGKVYLDAPPPYWSDPAIRSAAYEEWSELFGDRWDEVARLLAVLEKYGIWYADPKPANIDPGG